MIELLLEKPFAIGGKRECYVNPQDADICIKIHRDDALPSSLREQAPWWRSFRKGEKAFDESFSDWKVLKELSSSNDPIIWQHLPRLHGWVETDRGRGLAIELLRDDDGLISLTLLDWIWKNGTSEKLDLAINAFCLFWESQEIPSRSLGLHNIIAQEKNGDIRLVLIDGFGSTQLLPIAKWCSRYARRRSRSKTARLRRDIDELLERRLNNGDPGQRGFLLHRSR